VKEVQERLGHASASMTLDVYSHLWPSDEDQTRAVTDNVLGEVFEPACSGILRAKPF
jgi:integrase